MTTSSPYVTYHCDTCDRTTEIQLDARRPDPLRCNITLNCRGKLSRVGVHDVKRRLFTPAAAGLTDYYPRGTSITAVSTAGEIPQISLLTSKEGPGLALAVLKHRVNGANSEFYTTDSAGGNVIVESLTAALTNPTTATTIQIALYELQPELLKFKKYSYLINNSVQVIRGADNTPEENNLRFTSQNRVRVYVNGLELDDSEFDRTTENEIVFTPMITTINNLIEVIVYNDISATILDEAKLVWLNFKFLTPTVSADLVKRGNSCWGDVNKVTIEDADRFCFFCTDFSGLLSDRSYGVARVQARSTGGILVINPAETFILLGKHPFSFSDKELFAYVALDDLMDDVVLVYRRDVGKTEFTVADSEITQVTSPLTPLDHVSVTEAAVVPNTVATGTTTLKRKFTLGPT